MRYSIASSAQELGWPFHAQFMEEQQGTFACYSSTWTNSEDVTCVGVLLWHGLTPKFYKRRTKTFTIEKQITEPILHPSVPHDRGTRYTLSEY